MKDQGFVGQIDEAIGVQFIDMHGTQRISNNRTSSLLSFTESEDDIKAPRYSINSDARHSLLMREQFEKYKGELVYD